MRTTLTIDDDVMVRLRDEAVRLQVPVSEVVNMTLRRAISGTRVAKKVAPLKTYASKLRKGIKFNEARARTMTSGAQPRAAFTAR